MAADMQVTVAPVLVGGKSKQAFAGTLQAMLKAVVTSVSNSDAVAIKFRVDKKSIGAIKQTLKTEFEGIEIPIKVGTSSGKGGRGGSGTRSSNRDINAEELLALSKIETFQKRLQDSRNRLSKISMFGDQKEIDAWTGKVEGAIDKLEAKFKSGDFSWLNKNGLAEVNEAFADLGKHTSELTGIANAEKNAAKEAEKWEREAKEVGKSYQGLVDDFGKLNKLDQGAGADILKQFNDANDALKKAENPTKELVENYKNAEEELKGFIDQNKNAGDIFATIGEKALLAAKAFAAMQIKKYMRQMYQEVKEIDSALTQLQIVTGSSSATMRRFGDEVAGVAKNIAVSISDIVNSSTTYARLGYNLEESLNFAELTSMYSRVADVDVSAATTNITSMVKAFDIASEDLESALDKMTLVGNNFPISAAELGQGIQNAGSSLEAAGNTFEQSLALLTAAMTTTQDISKSSTALRTMSARIRNATSELQDLGEEVDSTYNTTAKYRDKLLAITGVDILESDMKTFRSTYDILNDIQKKWEELEDIDKASVTTMIAGTRQQNVFQSLMGNWNEAQNVITAVNDSAGTLSTAYDTYMDSIEGRTNQLKATFQSFSQTVLNSDLVKNGVTFLTKLVDALDKLFGSGFGKGLATFLAFRTGLGIIQQLFDQSSKLSGVMKLLGNSVTNVGAAFKSLGAAGTMSSAAFGGWLTLAAAAVGVIAGIVGSIKKAREEAIQAAKEDYEDFASQITSNEQSLSSVQELKNKLDESNISYEDAYNAREQLLGIKDQLIEAYGEEARSLDILGMSYEEVVNWLQRMQAAQATQAIEENKKVYDRAVKNVEQESQFSFQFATDDEALKNQLEDIFRETLSEINPEIEKGVWDLTTGQGSDFWFRADGLLEEQKIIEALIGKVSELGDGYEGVLSQLESARNIISNSEDLTAYKNFAELLIQSDRLAYNVDNDAEGILERYSDIYQMIMSADNELKRAMLSGDEELMNSAYATIMQLRDSIDFSLLPDPAAQMYWEDFFNKFDSRGENLSLKIKYEFDKGSFDIPDGILDSEGRFDKDAYQLYRSGQEVSGAFDQIEAAAEEAGVSVDTFVSAMERAGIITPWETEAIEEQSTAISKMVGEYNKLNNSMGAVRAAMQEQRSNGFMSADAQQALLEAFPDLGQLGRYVGGQFVIAEEDVNDYIHTMYELNDLDALTNLAEQYDALEEAQSHLGESSLSYVDEKYWTDQAKLIQENIDALEEFRWENAEAAKAFGDFQAALNTNDFQRSNTFTQAFDTITDSVNNALMGTDDFEEAMKLVFSEGFEINISNKDEILDFLASQKELLTSDDGWGFINWAEQAGLAVEDEFGRLKFDATTDTIKEALVAGTDLKSSDISDSWLYALVEKAEAIFGDVDLSSLFTPEQMEEYQKAVEEGKGETEKFSNSMDGVVDSSQTATAAAIRLHAAIGAPYDTSGLSVYSNRLNEVTGNLQRVIAMQGQLSSMGVHGANGLSFAGGMRALVGEEAPELKVNRRTGTWTIVGQNGAEFVDLSKGDIIFSGAQTKALLQNGKIGSRGKTIGGLSFAGTVKTSTPKTRRVVAVANTGVSSILLDNTNNSSGSTNSSNSSYSGNNSSSSSSVASDTAKAAEDAFEEVIDWIQVRLERLSTKTQRLVDSTIKYIGYTSKNSQLNKALDNIAVEMKTNQQAIQKYSEAMEGVGLSSYWQNRVKNGEIDIETITDEDLKKKIDEYQDLYEKQQKCVDAETELIEKQEDFVNQKFDNISDYYEGRIGVIENQISWLDSQMNYVEDTGNIVGESYYRQAIKYNNQQRKLLQDQRDAMKKALDESVNRGDIKVGSTIWYEQVQAIQDLDNELLKLDSDTEGYNNKLTQLKWDNFDRMIDQLDHVDDMLGRLGEYFSDNPVDDNGNWTKEGITALSAYAQQAELARYKVDEYSKAIKRLDKDYKDGKLSELEYKDKLQELTSAQWDSIEAYKEANNSIVELNKVRIDAVKEGIQEEIDAYSELIKKKKEELSAEKELKDFQDTVNEQQKDIADIQRQLAAMANDNSAATVAKRKKLQQDLYDAQEKLEKTYYDHSIKTQQEALDADLEAYKENQEKKMEDLDAYLKDEEQVVSDSLATVLENTKSVTSTYKALMNEYGISISGYITDPWKKGQDALAEYGEDLSAKTSAFIDGISNIKTHLTELRVQANADAAALVKSFAEMQTALTTTVKPKQPAQPSGGNNSGENNNGGNNGSNSGGGNNNTGTLTVGKTATFDNGVYYYSSSGSSPTGSYGRGEKVKIIYTSPGSKYPYAIQHVASGIQLGWVKASQLKGYAKGTLGVGRGQFAWVDELGDELALRAGTNGRLSYLTKGTSVIPADITRNLMELGKYDVNGLLSKYATAFSGIGYSQEAPVTEFRFDSLLHVDNATSDSVPLIKREIINILEDYNKKQNYALKKYTR